MPSTDRIVGTSSSEVIKRIKDELKNPANKIEGSFASDNAQAVGMEIAKYYAYMAWLQDMHYVDTAEGEFLDRKAAEVGIFRKGASYAYGSIRCYGEPGVQILSGDIFSSDTQKVQALESATIGLEGYVDIGVKALDAGEVGNLPERAIYESENHRIDRVENLEAITGGTDIEDDESLRERTLLRMRYPGTSGNKNHYMHWAMEVDGVGRVKVFPEWKGPGTVKVSILDRTQNIASEELMAAVKNHIDPEDGKGEALAPIGASLTVSTGAPKKINVDAKITIAKLTGYEPDGSETENIKQLFVEFLEAHLRSISYVEKSLSLAKVIDILWTIDGVADIPEITINGDTKNIVFDDEEVPVIGMVNIT